MENRGEINKEKNGDGDTTNWKAWYWALALLLLAQIIIYYLITNRFNV